MKKLLLCLLLLTSLLFCACAPSEKRDSVRVAGMTGPTSFGLVRLAELSETGDRYPYECTLSYASADEILPKLIQGELDMAALPANVAATLYQKTKGAVQVVAVNTLGAVSVVERKNTVSSLADLRGKTLYAVGRGTTPEYALTYLLNEAGVSLDEVNVVWKAKGTEILPLLKTDENAVAMLPEPFVSAALANVSGLHVALDLNEEWAKANNGTSSFVSGVMVARRAFLEANPALTATFLEDYEASISYAWATENLDRTASLILRYGILENENVAKASLTRVPLFFAEGSAMKTVLTDYLTVLFNENPAAVGGALPDDGFYYIPEGEVLYD